MANHSKVSVTSITRLENEQTTAQENTVKKLALALIQGGVEFTTGQGVRLRDEFLESIWWDGPNCLRSFQDDVLNVRLEHKGEALFCAVDEEKFVAFDPILMREFFVRVENLGKKIPFRERVLLHYKDRFFLGTPDTTQYRWLPKEFKGLVPYAVYGNKTAFIFWTKTPRILSIHNAQLAQTFRQNFEVLWHLSEPIPFSRDEILQIVRNNLKKYS